MRRRAAVSLPMTVLVLVRRCRYPWRQSASAAPPQVHPDRAAPRHDALQLGACRSIRECARAGRGRCSVAPRRHPPQRRTAAASRHVTPPGCALGGFTCYALRRAASACARQQWVVVSKCCGGGARVARVAAWQRRRAYPAKGRESGGWRRVSLRIEEELPAVAASKCASGKVIDRQARALDRLESAEQPKGLSRSVCRWRERSEVHRMRRPRAHLRAGMCGSRLRASLAGLAGGMRRLSMPPWELWAAARRSDTVLSAHSDGARAGHAHMSITRSTVPPTE